MLRILMGFWLIFSALAIAKAEPVYFVSVAHINPDKQVAYDAFLNAVSPIWKRHEMEVIMRMRVDRSTPFEDPSGPISEIGVLRAASMKQFHAYISDPDYQEIKQKRLDAVEKFFVLEGTADDAENIKFLATVPQAAIVFEPSALGKVKPNLRLSIRLAGQVKRPIGTFFENVGNVDIHALSFDDNPMSYATAIESNRRGLMLGGEILR